MEEGVDLAGTLRDACRATAVVGMAIALSGCFVASTLKSELSRYAEPTGEDLAHIRLIGSVNVKVYPNSTCARLDVPGGGYPAGPQLGGQRTRDLGMPKMADTPRHFVEIAARPGEPIAARFAFYTEQIRPGIAGTGMPNTKETSFCNVTGSFVPEANANYEARASWDRDACVLIVHRLVEVDGQLQRVPVARPAETTCGPAATEADTAADA
ncbi:hypothetical protein ACF3M1_01490 [Luteimonas sp. WGS1318]|uniref:hypothetical protein n=1 Tax=Luteimonas sp. WGS1318 TaxID=3366815 RepID=UPI00372D5B96